VGFTPLAQEFQRIPDGARLQRVPLPVSAVWHLFLVNERVTNAPEPKALLKYRPHDVQLLVDGGSENNNHHVETLIQSSGGTIHKLIAQKEIDFSNSMVESVNHLLKNGYLRPMGIDSPKHLPDAIDFSINDINHVRPHNAIGGLVPIEALRRITINTEERQQQLQKARAERLEHNRKNICGKCH